MNRPDELIQLVVCSGGRAGELARVLKQAGTVYRRWSENGQVWGYYLFDQDRWKTVGEEEEVPARFHVLFFHTGEQDPKGIPGDRTFDREFAFSTGSLPAKGPYGGREKAVAIRRFPTGNCPVKTRHLYELKDFVVGARTELPTFCRRDETVPILWALAILSQGFAAAGVARDAIKADDALLSAIGWERLQAEQIAQLSDRLGGLWDKMRGMNWWLASLGVIDAESGAVNDVKYRALLARLIQDLELDVRARQQLALSAEANIAERPADDLLGFLQLQPRASRIADLLSTQEAQPAVVEAAYTQLKWFLEQS